MERVMYDVYIAEAMIENDYQHFYTPEKKEAYIHKIFTKHNITQAQWDSSLAWYSDRIEVYLKMNDSVKAELQRQQKDIEKKLNNQLAQEQASSIRFLSVSYIPRLYTFASDMSDGFRFRLDSTDISEKITENDFSFRFNVIGIPPDTIPELQSLLILEYKDTTMYQSQKITRNDFYRISASKYIPEDTLRKISGFVRLENRANDFRNIRLYNIVLGNESEKEPKDNPHPEASLSAEEPLQPSRHKEDTAR